MKVMARRLQIVSVLLAGLLVAMSLSACYSNQSTVDTAAEADTIMALEREWSQKFGDGDIEWIMDLHAADAVQLPPGAEPVVGLDAMRAAWQGMIDTEGLEISWQPTAAYVSTSGDMAYDYGTATMTTPDGSAPMKYLVVWTRQDGQWKVAADMFNANQAPN